jgi:toxin HigB-1
MEFEFANRKLEELYYEDEGTEEYPESVVVAFVNRMAVVDAAKDERDLRSLKSLHFEKLEPKNSNRYSLRLSGRWRLVFSFEPPSGADKRIVVEEISNHYGD